MPTWEDLSYRVAKASGMVSVQADCTIEQALDLMKERARFRDQSLKRSLRALLSGGSGSPFSASQPHGVR